WRADAGGQGHIPSPAGGGGRGAPTGRQEHTPPAPHLQFRRPRLVDGVQRTSPHRSVTHFVTGEGGRRRTASSSGERCTVSCVREVFAKMPPRLCGSVL
ncbi:Os04g0677033, partial [Oryza sativa Japonica Group]